MYRQTGMYSGPLEYNFVMGVASGMPADPELLPILLKLKAPDAHWQVTAIGRAEIWPLHQRCADLGGHLRTGLEDTFYLADGTKTGSNGALVDMLARCARDAGRAIAESRRGARPHARNCSRSDAARGGTICDGHELRNAIMGPQSAAHSRARVSVTRRSLQEIADAFSDLACMCFQGEVAGVEETDNGAAVPCLNASAPGCDEERIVLAPNCQKRWLVRSKVFLE